MLNIQFAIDRQRLPENHFGGHIVFSPSIRLHPPTLPNNSTNE